LAVALIALELPASAPEKVVRFAAPAVDH